MKRTRIAAAVLLAFAPLGALATNGMNMEGYGPISTGMGGASMAYDNGAAAMMNNPATIGLMPEGQRIDGALGNLGPKITSSMAGQSDAASSATSFWMPAAGWVKKAGPMAYGLGVFAQGGMGTQYDANSFMSAGSGRQTRSEVGVMRIMVPFAFDMNPAFKLGGSIDYVRASMDLQMAMSGSQLMDMMPTNLNPGAKQNFGTVSGSMINTFGQAMGAGQITGINWGYFDFSDSNKFSGKAQGNGFAAKIGGVYKVSPKLSLGAAYHSKTQIGDLEATGATVSMNVTLGAGLGGGQATVPVTGKISVKNFQWPETYGFGMAYQMSDSTMLVADYKNIGWAKVMKDFKMTFTADSTQSGMAGTFGLGGAVMDATMYQNWKDQNVFMLGTAIKGSETTTWRAGLNVANNPIPDYYMNPLFPAIVKNHLMGGVGYTMSKVSSVDFSLTYAPSVSVTNGQGVTTKHGQTNWQLIYSYRF